MNEFCEQHAEFLTQINKRLPVWVFLGSMAVIFALFSITFTTLRSDIINVLSLVTQVDRKVIELDTKINVMRSYSTHHKER
jgi:heme/copper-type cytochrome/quinol oxidase subunit 3